MKTRQTALSTLLVVAIAFGLRLWHLYYLEASPFANALMGDSVGYDVWAREVASGDWFGHEVFYQAPLYPYFLGAMYATSGDELVWIRMIQAALGAAGCGLLVLATARFFQSVPAGLVAGLTLAFFAPGIFHDTLIQKSVLDIFFLCLLLWALALLVDRPRMVTWCAAGAILGCLILTRENATLLAFAIFIWIVIHFRKKGRQRIAFAACFLMGLGLLLGPVAARNYVLSGELHLTTSQLGPNLYIGNHEGATGTYVPLRWGRGSSLFERDDAVEVAELESGEKMNARQTSQYWQKRAIDYALSQPVDWLRVTSLKFALLWNATEVIDTEDQYTYAEFSPPLLVLGWITHFGILSPLALLGLIITWPQRKRLWILYAMITCYAASVLIFYVVARYRLPLAPLLIPFAAAGLANLPRWIRSTRLITICVTGAAFLLVATFTNWNLVNRDGMRAATYYNLGTAAASRGENQTAIEQYRKALEIFPDQSEALVNLASELMGQGKNVEAMALYERALVAAPGVATVQLQVAMKLAEHGRIDEALLGFGKALTLDPNLAGAHYGKALVLVGKGRVKQGFKYMQTAMVLDPELLLRLRGVTWSLATKPTQRGSGQIARALVMARWVRALSQPDDPKALDLLAVATAANGQFKQAIALTNKAIKLADASEDAALVATFKIHRAFYIQGAPFYRRTPASQNR